MENFLLGVLIGGLLFCRRSRSSAFDVTAGLRGYLNRKRYERLAMKARVQGFEADFIEQWESSFSSVPFELQKGIESIWAYRFAQRKAADRLKAK